ncbi:MAG: UbiA prenyltransferase family protein [Candidatus Bathyarchaeota archaeon]|nr:UbiA prenyltransferase family protein [Candidatus Bathyarchaeota archaeon]
MKSFRFSCFFALEGYLRAARVESWLGWFFSFFFGCIFLGLPSLERTAIASVAFSFATASIFVLNQYFDREEDQKNLIKSNLPIASGKMMPQTALIFSFLLITSCLALTVFTDVNLAPLFLIYLALWTAYSAPPFRLKAVPTVDFIISGIGAGLLPFLIGVSVSRPPIINILIILLSAIPLMLAHCSGHVLQALGDYEADRKAGVQTFVVKHGRKKGAALMGLLSLATGAFPFIYTGFGLFSPSYIPLFFIPLPFCIPIARCYVNVLKDPTTENVVALHKTLRKWGVLIMFVVEIYVLAGKILAF